MATGEGDSERTFPTLSLFMFDSVRVSRRYFALSGVITSESLSM
jgi:hypothetical protein